jgi:hypothetical protein
MANNQEARLAIEAEAAFYNGSISKKQENPYREAIS